jgi:hypothetical protein
MGLTYFGAIVEQVRYRADNFITHRHGDPAAAMVPMPVCAAWKRQRQEFFNQIRNMQREADLEPDTADRLAARAVATARA